MTLDAIAIFIKVVQCGGFTQAAKFLRMPVSTVSAKISTLEKKLGVTLLQRTTRKVQVTEAGETYFKRCVYALEVIQEAESQISMRQKEPQGLLKITAPVDIGNNVLPEIIANFLNKYQQMQIELLVTNRIVNLVEEGIDLAIRAGELKDSGLITKKFITEQLSLWASPSYLERKGTPLHPNELNRHEFLQYSFCKGKRIILSNDRESAEVITEGRIILDSPEAARKLTLLSQGIGLLHNFITRDDVKDGKLVRILPQWQWYLLPYYFVYPPQQFISLKIRAFIDFSEKYMKKFYNDPEQVNHGSS